MRASVLVLGPLLARAGRARVSLPGGCAIGPRPVDLHLFGLERMGAEIAIADGYIDARAPRGLSGARIALPSVSVGATENLMMAAALARGRTVIANAAREPEVVDLAACLAAMGARIDGAGSGTVTVDGVDSLSGARHAALPDRIEAGTYAVAAAIAGGCLELVGADAAALGPVMNTPCAAGAEVEATDGGVRVARRGERVRGFDVVTAPYPGFPTDMQAQTMALTTIADGASLITERIFENRFMHVPELARMGADITVHGGSAMVRGVAALTGAPVMATDLRASVSLVLAGLAARGGNDDRAGLSSRPRLRVRSSASLPLAAPISKGCAHEAAAAPARGGARRLRRARRLRPGRADADIRNDVAAAGAAFRRGVRSFRMGARRRCARAGLASALRRAERHPLRRGGRGARARA